MEGGGRGARDHFCIDMLTPPKIYISVVFVPRRVRQRQYEYRKDCCETEETKNPKDTQHKQKNTKTKNLQQKNQKKQQKF